MLKDILLDNKIVDYGKIPILCPACQAIEEEYEEEVNSDLVIDWCQNCFDTHKPINAAFIYINKYGYIVEFEKINYYLL